MKQYKSSLPSFSAEASLVKSDKTYGTGGAGNRRAQSPVVTPQGYSTRQSKAVVVPQYNSYLCMHYGIECD